ncbi:MAG: hypothetical protein GF320_14930, partial [Armatimonadia bacterium]|nr:hypothetical protein [Armatimonadia bacterium]
MRPFGFPSPHILAGLVLLSLSLCVPALSQTPPDPATWERSEGTVFNPITGETVDAMSGEIVVTWRSDATSEQKADARAVAVGAELRSLANLREEVLIVEPGRESDAMAALDAHPAVDHVAPNYVCFLSQDGGEAFTPDDPGWSNQQALHELTRSPEAWRSFAPSDWDGSSRFPVGNEGVIIAIIDTGVDTEHPELEPNL